MSKILKKFCLIMGFSTILLIFSLLNIIYSNSISFSSESFTPRMSMESFSLDSIVDFVGYSLTETKKTIGSIDISPIPQIYLVCLFISSVILSSGGLYYVRRE